MRLVGGDDGPGQVGVVDLVQQRGEHRGFVGPVDRDGPLGGHEALVEACRQQRRGQPAAESGTLEHLAIDVQAPP
ncbi:MAG TPA: hypothetical protein VFM55_05375 [Micromonosporaceae bacterium]|nr:hypothetical protein [Micromonosporaceae bacterium]